MVQWSSTDKESMKEHVKVFRLCVCDWVWRIRMKEISVCQIKQALVYILGTDKPQSSCGWKIFKFVNTFSDYIISFRDFYLHFPFRTFYCGRWCRKDHKTCSNGEPLEPSGRSICVPELCLWTAVLDRWGYGLVKCSKPVVTEECEDRGVLSVRVSSKNPFVLFCLNNHVKRQTLKIPNKWSD